MVTDAVDPPMEHHIYELVDSLAETYWRYVARHEAFAALWKRYRRPQAQYRVLDVGCGTGGLLSYLARHAPVQATGVDLFPGTLPYCRRRGVDAVGVADATALPFPTATFDFVVTQDVVEHVADDRAALGEIARVCTPGGVVLALVPAFQFLWSARDVELNHYRRYTVAQLAQVVERSGLVVLHRTYMDAWLLPLLWAAVRAAPRTPDGLADLQADGAPGAAGWVNRVLLAVARLEASYALRASVPFGVSAVVLARKPFGNEGG
jgi:ubiquinone/menaquinone biosynthesis C-methylase UbiE